MRLEVCSHLELRLADSGLRKLNLGKEIDWRSVISSVACSLFYTSYVMVDSVVRAMVDSLIRAMVNSVIRAMVDSVIRAMVDSAIRGYNKRKN